MNWNTQEVIDAIQKLVPKGAKVEIFCGREDYTTSTLVVNYREWDDTQIVFRGFNPEAPLKGEDNFEISMVELGDNLADSRGGFGSTDSELRRVGLEIEKFFRDKDVNVVPNLTGYY